MMNSKRENSGWSAASCSRRVLFALMCFFFCCGFKPNFARTWTSSKGKTLRGDFIALTESDAYLWDQERQKIFTVRRARFSPPDQKYLIKKEKGDENVIRTINLKEPLKFTTGRWQLSFFKNLPIALYGDPKMDSSRKYPLVITLHGRILNRENEAQISFAERFVRKENYARYPCFIVAPLSDTVSNEGDSTNSLNFWTDDSFQNQQDVSVRELIQVLLKENPLIDARRVYVVSESEVVVQPKQNVVKYIGHNWWQIISDEQEMFAAGVSLPSLNHKIEGLPNSAFCLYPRPSEKSVYVVGSGEEMKGEFKCHDFSRMAVHPMGEEVSEAAIFRWLFEQSREGRKQ